MKEDLRRYSSSQNLAIRLLAKLDQHLANLSSVTLSVCFLLTPLVLVTLIYGLPNSAKFIIPFCLTIYFVYLRFVFVLRPQNAILAISALPSILGPICAQTILSSIYKLPYTEEHADYVTYSFVWTSLINLIVFALVRLRSPGQLKFLLIVVPLGFLAAFLIPKKNVLMFGPELTYGLEAPDVTLLLLVRVVVILVITGLSIFAYDQSTAD